MFFAAAVVGDRIGTWVAIRRRFAASQAAVAPKQILPPSSTSTTELTLAVVLGHHLPRDLVGLVTVYARTRDRDLIVAVETDADDKKTAWLCGPYGQDVLAGWRLPIVPDTTSYYPTPPCLAKAVDLDDMPGVTLVMRGRVKNRNGRDRLQMFLVRLPLALEMSDGGGGGMDDADGAEHVDQRQPTVTEFLPTTAPWRDVWHDEHQLISGLRTRWSPAAAEWTPPTDDDLWRMRNDYDDGATEFGWDATVKYGGYWLRWRLDRIEWTDPTSLAEDADGNDFAPAHSRPHRHGVAVDVAANMLYLLARCCECHGTADHPESLVVWSAPLAVTLVAAGASADPSVGGMTQASVAVAAPPTWRRRLSIGLWRPHIVSGLWTGILHLPPPRPSPRYDIRTGQISAIDGATEAAVVWAHTRETVYHLRGTLPDGRLWFATGGGSFVVQAPTGGGGDRDGGGEKLCCGWRHSGDGESLYRLLGFTEQPNRRFCSILA